jgi:hypothetical protein
MRPLRRVGLRLLCFGNIVRWGILVHHTRKNGAAGIAAAFGDSNLYLKRTKDRLLLSSKHRAAPASPPVYLELVATNAQTTHLKVVTEPHDHQPAGLPEQVLSLPADGAVLTRAGLRDLLGVKNERLGQALESLEQAGRLRHTPAGWQRVD